MPEAKVLKPRSKTTQAWYAERVKGEAKYTTEQNAEALRVYLEARRRRVGFTMEDYKQSPDFMK
jgi:hypothetical protein